MKVFKTAFLLSTYELLLLLSEVIAHRCSLKKVLQKISENPQENTSARVSSFIKFQADPCNFIKETLAQVFSCEFCEILRTLFFIEHIRWLLLYIGLIVSKHLSFFIFFSKLKLQAIRNFNKIRKPGMFVRLGKYQS